VINIEEKNTGPQCVNWAFKVLNYEYVTVNYDYLNDTEIKKYVEERTLFFTAIK
jgi:hypothetical protein